MKQMKVYKYEAFRERKHLHVSDLWPLHVTFTLCQGQKAYLTRLFYSIVLWTFGTRYDVCEQFVRFDH